MTAVKLILATIFPMMLTGIFTMAEKKTGFYRWGYYAKQIIIGFAFGGFAVLSTEFGIPVADGAIMNVRDSAPLCAGLIFGAPAGFIAGLIGGVHRWFCVYWGGTMYTRTACSLATLLAGVFSALMRKSLFEDEKPNWLAGSGLGMTMEVLHMLLVLLTNLDDVSYAFTFVQICAVPMIILNGVAVGLSILASGIVKDKNNIGKKTHMLSYDFGFRLLICIVIAFIITSSFVYKIVSGIKTNDTELFRNVTVYLTVFMEILVYSALFILIYQMLKKKVVLNLEKVNEGLNEISSGNLNTVIDVRTHKEFSELSDDVNATVATLKRYIKDAEERIDKELIFARQIQHSALPSVFPPFPNRLDFDLFASMDAAKEVGGDFYDFYLLDRFQLIMMIADVSGKGIPAAMFMMTAKTLIKGLAESGRPVDEVFNEANRKLCENNEAGMFITAWIGKLDLRTGQLSYVNAGHNPPLICRKGKSFEYLRTKPNFILAGMDTTVYRRQEIKLELGDSLYLYTDGVTEAVNIGNELYGEPRLESFMAALSGKHPKDVCEAVKNDVLAFADGAPQADDITMLCVRLNAMQDRETVKTYPDMDSLSIVVEYLNDRLKTTGIPVEVINKVQVVADEVYSNIVNYSGATGAEVSFSRENDMLFLTFKDNGTPFDPTGQQDPDITLPAEEREIGGLGILMVRKMTSSIEYEYKDGLNVLTLTFKLNV